MNLAQVRTLQRERPNTSGFVNLNADVTGNLAQTKKNGKDETEFLLTSVNGGASAREFGLRARVTAISMRKPRRQARPLVMT